MQTQEKIYAPNYQPFRWKYDQYVKLFEQGFLGDRRTELIDGEIVYMSAMNADHYWAVTQADDILQKAFAGGKFVVAAQLPLKIDDENAPQPDLAVIEGSRKDFGGAIPHTAALVVEIADSSLAYDRAEKASLYAKAGVQDYWIVNLPGRRLEIYRRPIADEDARHGFSYGEMFVAGEDETASPLAAPEAKIRVADLLP